MSSCTQQIQNNGVVILRSLRRSFLASTSVCDRPVVFVRFPHHVSVRPFLLQNASIASFVNPMSFTIGAYSKPLLWHFMTIFFSSSIMRSTSCGGLCIPPTSKPRQKGKLEGKIRKPPYRAVSYEPQACHYSLLFCVVLSKKRHYLGTSTRQKKRSSSQATFHNFI